MQQINLKNKASCQKDGIIYFNIKIFKMRLKRSTRRFMVFYLGFLTLLLVVWFASAASHIYGNDEVAPTAVNPTSSSPTISEPKPEPEPESVPSPASESKTISAPKPASRSAPAVRTPAVKPNSTSSSDDQPPAAPQSATPTVVTEPSPKPDKSPSTLETSQVFSLQLVQKNDVVTASGQGLSEFAYFVAGSKPVCSDGHQGRAFTAGRIVTALKHQQWICFRAKNSAQTYTYESWQVDLTSPTISISQFKDTISVNAHLSGLGKATVSESTWQKIKTPTAVEPVCATADFSKPSSITKGRGIVVNKNDNNKWLCYRVSSSLGVYGYAKYQLDYNAPTITVSVSTDGQTLTASTSATDLPSNPAWQKSSHNDRSNCHTATSFTPGRVVSNLVSNKYYCFSVADKVGNEGFVEFFNRQQASTYSPPSLPSRAPSIVLWLLQDGKVVKVDKSKSRNISRAAIKYFTSISYSDCSTSNTIATYKTYDAIKNNGVGGLGNNHWVCFKASKNSQVVFAQFQIDLTRPSFSLSQDRTTVAMSATSGLSGIGYFEASSEPPTTGASSCSDDKTSGWTADADGSITGVADNKWICFRAKNTIGVYGYAKLQVDLSKPSFTLSQDNTTVAMSTISNLTDIGYFQADSEPPTTGDSSCSDEKTTGWTADGDGSITGFADKKWVCFRAKNALNVYGYAKLQVDLSRPSFTLSQDNTTVAISAKSGLSDFAYFQANSDPPTTGATSCSDDKNDWLDS